MSGEPNSQFRLLFVDDNPSIHEDYQKILAPMPKERSAFDDDDDFLFGERTERPVTVRWTFEFASAFQGKDALKMVEQSVSKGRPFSVALVDVRMPPGWDGIETARRIWDVDPSLIIVFCTAYSDYSWSEMTASLGRTDQFVILKKPFDNLELLQLVGALADKWSLERQLETVTQVDGGRSHEANAMQSTLI